MKHKEYHIIIHSVTRHIISFLIILFVTLTLFDYVPWKKNDITITIEIIIVFSISNYLGGLISRAKVKIVFTEEKFLHIWEKRFILDSEKDIEIPWNIMTKKYFHQSKMFGVFTINLKTNKRYRIYKFNLFPVKDDFDRLMEDFPSLKNKHREQ